MYKLFGKRLVDIAIGFALCANLHLCACTNHLLFGQGYHLLQSQENRQRWKDVWNV
mgnify:CR=1 FL=1